MLNYFDTLEKVTINNDEFWVLQWLTDDVAQAIRCSDVQGGAHFAIVCVIRVKSV